MCIIGRANKRVVKRQKSKIRFLDLRMLKHKTLFGALWLEYRYLIICKCFTNSLIKVDLKMLELCANDILGKLLGQIVQIEKYRHRTPYYTHYKHEKPSREFYWNQPSGLEIEEGRKSNYNVKTSL